MKPLGAIVGPTATGKSPLAIALARAFQGEVVNADSRQVYRLMDVGTAKPTREEQAQVPHHLLDLVNPGQEFSLALFLRHATQAIAATHAQGKLPLLVGGTGQYVWALLEGWEVPLVAPDPDLRLRLEEQAHSQGVASLYAQLQQVDPEAAARVHPHNLRRIIRALEVYHQTGVAFSQARGKSTPPYRTLVLGLTLPRQELYTRIDQRVDRMLGQGWIEEVRHLMELGYSPDDAALSSLGYRELVAYLQGQLSLEEATQRIKHATHRFARHQEAWFRLRDPRIHWLKASPAAYEDACALVAAVLSENPIPCATIEAERQEATSTVEQQDRLEDRWPPFAPTCRGEGSRG